MNRSNVFLPRFHDVIDLLFPRLCFNCQESLSSSEQIICVTCKANLPVIDHRTNIENYHEKFLDVTPQDIFCFLQFRKDNITQKLLHEFKYNGFRKIGWTLGYWFGEYIKDIHPHTSFDALIPVPLHANKLRKRGFNQSHLLAKGLSLSLKLPIITNVIERVLENKTQTLKSRADRMFNVRGLFEVKSPERIKNLNLLILDDVITTGSTLAECAMELKKNGASTISIASLAMAK